MDQLYHDILLDLYRHPLNKVVPEHYSTHTTEHNPLCGEELTLYIGWSTQGTIETIGWQGDGCAISQTAASLLTEELKGKTVAEAQSITLEQLLCLLGLTDLNPTRQRCASLGLVALKKIIV